MRLPSKHVALPLSLAAASLLAGPTSALGETYTVTFEVKDTDVAEEVLQLEGNPCDIEAGEELIRAEVSATVRGLGELRAENESDSSTAIVNMSHELVSASIKMDYAPGGLFVEASAGPFEVVDRELTVFDGDKDFGGTSGFTEETFCCDLNTDSRTYTDPTELAAFDGPFDVIFMSDGEDASSSSGGNADFEILTQAGGDASVTYTCRTDDDKPPQPVPAIGPLGLLVLAGGLAGIGGWLQRGGGRRTRR